MERKSTLKGPDWGKSMTHLWEEGWLVWLQAGICGAAPLGRKAKVHWGPGRTAPGGWVEEFGLYYKSNGKSQVGWKPRNVTIYCVFKRSQLQSGEGLKKMLLGDQIRGW